MSHSSSVARVPIELTSHCVDRFKEHFRPCLDFPGAEAELHQLVKEHSHLSYTRPTWVKPLGPRDEAVAYVEIQGILALPLVPHSREHGVLVATTCIARGCITHAERDRRRRRRPKQASRRRRP